MLIVKLYLKPSKIKIVCFVIKLGISKIAKQTVVI